MEKECVRWRHALLKKTEALAEEKNDNKRLQCIVLYKPNKCRA